MSERQSLTGGCLCGAFRYEITCKPEAVCACHCTDCQRLTGSAFSMAALVPADTFRANNAPLTRHVSDTDRGSKKARWLCAECNVWVFGGPPLGSAPVGAVRFIRAGTLDDTSRLQPTIHFWTRSAQPWVILPKHGFVFETQPEDFMEWVMQVVQTADASEQS